MTASISFFIETNTSNHDIHTPPHYNHSRSDNLRCLKKFDIHETNLVRSKDVRQIFMIFSIGLMEQEFVLQFDSSFPVTQVPRYAGAIMGEIAPPCGKNTTVGSLSRILSSKVYVMRIGFRPLIQAISANRFGICCD